MKPIAVLVAFASFMAAPAFAQAPPKPSDVVNFSGRYVGQDPDAGIRSEMRRDWGHYNGNGD